MTDAGHAVREAAATIPAEVSARFATAAKLSDEDKKTVVEIARKALGPFQPKPETKPEVKGTAKVEPQPGKTAEAKPMPDAKARPAGSVETKPKVESPPPAEVKPAAKAESKEKP